MLGLLLLGSRSTRAHSCCRLALGSSETVSPGSYGALRRLGAARNVAVWLGDGVVLGLGMQGGKVGLRAPEWLFLWPRGPAGAAQQPKCNLQWNGVYGDQFGK
jgi:hypothetical protein